MLKAAQRFLACKAHGGAALAMLERAARTAPVLRPAAKLVNRGLAHYTDYRARSFDRLHGTDTFTRETMTSLGVNDDNRFSTWSYGPICHDFFHEIAHKIPRRRELTFFDVGSGKGLPLMLARDKGFRRVVGIELSQKLCETAAANFSRYEAKTGRSVGAEVVCGDFMQYRLPAEPTAFFLNSPFPHEVAAQAITHIESSVAEHPRRVVIAWRRMAPATLQRLQTSKAFKLQFTTPYWQIFANDDHR